MKVEETIEEMNETCGEVGKNAHNHPGYEHL